MFRKRPAPRRVLQKPTEKFDLTHIPAKIVGGNNNRGFRQPGFIFEHMIPAWVEKSGGEKGKAVLDQIIELRDGFDWKK